MLEKSKSLLGFAGTLKNKSRKLDEIFGEILEDRKKFKFKKPNFILKNSK